MTAPAHAALPRPCQEDQRLGELVIPTREEHADLERRIAAAVAAGHLQQARAAGDTFAAVGGPVELHRSLTRAQVYPSANATAQWYSDDYASVEFSFLRAVVLHTTETSGWPGYGGGASAPTLTALPDVANKRLLWRQHFRLGESARALVNAPGGVSTNTANVVQIELVGTCAAGGPGLHWPTAPDWALAELAKFLRWLRATWGVQLTSTVRWEAYPGSYGLNNGERLSASAWLAYRGLLGHEHVPENDHGDCGLFRISRLLDFCTPATPQENTVALTQDEIDTVVASVWGRTWKEYYDRDHDGVRDEQTAADALVGGFSAASQARDGVQALATQVDALVDEQKRTNDLLADLVAKLAPV